MNKSLNNTKAFGILVGIATVVFFLVWVSVQLDLLINPWLRTITSAQSGNYGYFFTIYHYFTLIYLNNPSQFYIADLAFSIIITFIIYLYAVFKYKNR